jgi:hypothetical protein
MTLLELMAVFVAIGPATYHYEAPDGTTGNYIVWAEDNQSDAVWADGQMQEQAIEGTLDYFTKTEFDPMTETIQAAMNNADLSWRLNSVQREPDTGYIHHEWTWSIWHG